MTEKNEPQPGTPEFNELVKQNFEELTAGLRSEIATEMLPMSLKEQIMNPQAALERADVVNMADNRIMLFEHAQGLAYVADQDVSDQSEVFGPGLMIQYWTPEDLQNDDAEVRTAIILFSEKTDILNFAISILMNHLSDREAMQKILDVLNSIDGVRVVRSLDEAFGKADADE